MNRFIPICLCLILAVACGPKQQTKVILLPQDDGPTGAVVVRNQTGETSLDEPYTFISSKRQQGELKVEKADPEEIRKTYGGLFAAELKRPKKVTLLTPDPDDHQSPLPRPPKEYTLYFKPGTLELEDDSKTLLETIRQTIRLRRTTHIFITGFADTVGGERANLDLSLARAAEVAMALKPVISAADQVDIKGYGEAEPAVPTPDETDERRNRRVIVHLHY